MSPDSAHPHRLVWSPLRSFRELLLDDDNYHEPGVYVWIEDANRELPIYYVGKSESDLWLRQWEHYTAFIAGHYQMPATARRGDWEMNPKDPSVRETVFDEDRYLALVREGFARAAELRVSLCPLEKGLTKAVERQLLYELAPSSKTPGKKSPPRQTLDLVHVTPPWLGRGDGQVRRTVRVEAIGPGDPNV